MIQYYKRSSLAKAGSIDFNKVYLASLVQSLYFMYECLIHYTDRQGLQKICFKYTRIIFMRALFNKTFYRDKNIFAVLS